ncbi:MAG: 2-amino-4-hydroxy-6-hydroxymethyldihydropteridine diphosphokinase [Planctomycetales bacterium]|nr:2-amino-4-hydroxy-6-hydroxymethyldihydropteridine diphosphokinase [Planctomycetales bacterium]
MPRCYLALGGNQGEVAATFDRCLRRLANIREVCISRVSRFIETAPVGERGAVDPQRFLNAVAELDTTLPADELLTLCQRVEDECGRVRTVHWGPRTLDLDLILYGQEVIDSPRLKVPHPACWYRRFVLDPLVEIAPDIVHPIKQLSVSALRDRLLVRPLHVSIAGDMSPSQRESLIVAARTEFPDVVLTAWEQRSSWPVATPEPALILWFEGQRDSSATSTISDLPLATRLDATEPAEAPGVFLRHVLQAALNR